MLNASLRVHDSNMEPRILNPPRCQFPQLAIKSTNGGNSESNWVDASFEQSNLDLPAVVVNLQLPRSWDRTNCAKVVLFRAVMAKNSIEILRSSSKPISWMVVYYQAQKIFKPCLTPLVTVHGHHPKALWGAGLAPALTTPLPWKHYLRVERICLVPDFIGWHCLLLPKPHWAISSLQGE